MRSVVQRVNSASVQVDGGTVAAIGRGLLVLTGVFDYDEGSDLAWMAKRIAQLRVFPDSAGRMNLGPHDVEAEILLVSQFTLCANIRKGNRPSFTAAMAPELAVEMVQQLAEAVAAYGLSVKTGVFGALMEVELVNDGPVTIVLDSREFR
ncbi:MAG: D-tyrosyl-tRNA(Tyr) deacylase [Candidatus Riflebacteria bacterium RBG_13_59_9]|nr:MAG: D-tyrosyl-tRNA(Tyr) deacylase [Candidatus Riflebacteria bacterium RBG_13_59_9]